MYHLTSDFKIKCLEDQIKDLTKENELLWKRVELLEKIVYELLNEVDEEF